MVWFGLKPEGRKSPVSTGANLCLYIQSGIWRRHYSRLLICWRLRLTFPYPAMSRTCVWNSGLLWIIYNTALSRKLLLFFVPTFSVSSFLTDLRLARRSKDTLCLEPRSERRMASAETLTLLRLGLLNFPRRSRTLMFKSLICRIVRSFSVRYKSFSLAFVK